MKSVWWKCKYCGTKARVAEVARGRRVRCPACASFSKVRKFAKRGSKGKQSKGDSPGKSVVVSAPHFNHDSESSEAVLNDKNSDKQSRN